MTVQVIRTLDTVKRVEGVSSIFLAGPTYRISEDEADSEDKPSWRDQVVDALEKKFQSIVVFYPEWENNKKPDNWTYEKQLQWESDALELADIIMFWIPRDTESLPGFTTNIEFGEWMHSDKIVVGAPESADKVRYIKEKCITYDIPWVDNITSLVRESVALLMEKQQQKIWFTADTHFGSERALTLSRRPFASVEEMDWEMIKRWNLKVSKNNDVFHLGDFGDFSVLQHLNYRKLYLLWGNYERDDLDRVSAVLQDYPNVTIFPDTNKDAPVNIQANDCNFYLVHEPAKYNPKLIALTDGFYLFGHIHGRQMVKPWGLDVGVDAHHFYPINLSEVLWYKNAIENHYDHNVFI